MACILHARTWTYGDMSTCGIHSAYAIIIIILPLIWLRHLLNLTSILDMHMYTIIYNEQPVTQDSN